MGMAMEAVCVCRVSDAKCFDQSVQSQGQP